MDFSITVNTSFTIWLTSSYVAPWTDWAKNMVALKQKYIWMLKKQTYIILFLKVSFWFLCCLLYCNLLRGWLLLKIYVNFSHPEEMSIFFLSLSPMNTHISVNKENKWISPKNGSSFRGDPPTAMSPYLKVSILFVACCCCCCCLSRELVNRPLPESTPRVIKVWSWINPKHYYHRFWRTINICNTCL